MRKNFFLIVWLLITLITCTVIIGQDLKSESIADSVNNTAEIRKVFIYTSIGKPELLALGVGYQLSHEFAISIKGSTTFTGGGGMFPSNASGIGTKISYYIPFFLNCINFESILLFDQELMTQTPAFIKGYHLDLNIGKEVIDEKGLRVFWSVGISGNNTPDVPGLLTYSFKIGLNFNFY